MSRWGRVDENNEIVEFVDFDPEGLFDPEIEWVKIPEETEFLINVVPMVYDGQSVKAESIHDTAEALKRLIAETRYAVEVGGIVMADGTKIKTDRESQSIIDGILTRMEKNQELVLDFKAASGWATMDKILADAVADAVAIHVQACFSREKGIGVALDKAAEAGVFDGLISVYESEKLSGWPDNSIYIQSISKKQA